MLHVYRKLHEIVVSLRASSKECIQISLLDDLNSASVWKASPLGICSEVLLVVQELEEDVRAVESENDEGKGV